MMAQNCPACSRVNPSDALYCYQDGTPLQALTGKGAQIDPGSRPFPTPFVFPTGLTCQTFDQLALGCVNNWPAAVDLLRQGYLAGFLGGLGRADLALAAKEAAAYPDPDRGLEQFLARLPARSLVPPKLVVESRQVNLGELRPGTDRTINVQLHNQGMGLLYGDISCEGGPWLTVGEGHGVSGKVFQFRFDTTIPVQIRGQHLRAGNKPLQGRIVIQSNGGTETVAITAVVPIVPFADGVLGGARTPRQVAEKAKANPKGAAVLFEKGEVANWYRANGWDYPVPGPAASGVAAVQQFFEALGLTAPPKVEINEKSITAFCKAGEAIRHTLIVSSPERRPVYARASSDKPWLKVAAVKHEGRTATIILAIPIVPDVPGETLEALVTVTANGNQQFKVPVVISVSGTRRPTHSAPVLSLAAVSPDAPTLELPPPISAHSPSGNRHTAGVGTPIPVAAVLEPEIIDIPLLSSESDAAPARERPGRLHPTGRGSSAEITVEPLPIPVPAGSVPTARVLEIPDDEESVRGYRRGRPGRENSLATQKWMKLAPVLFIVLGLLGAFIHDVVVWSGAPAVGGDLGGESAGTGTIALHFHNTDVAVALGSTGLKPGGGGVERNRIKATWYPSMRFGLIAKDETGSLGGNKMLTFEEKGLSNNTCVKLDDGEYLFGEKPFRTETGEDRPNDMLFPGRWLERETPLGEGGTGRRSVWYYDAQKVKITQMVEVVRGAQTGLLDTCLIRYRLENEDRQAHRVGIRFLLDTFIGGNDGVPFLIPGQRELCSTFFRFSKVPDFIQALEKEDLANPGTIAHIQFNLGNGLEPPTRVTLGAYPNPRLINIYGRQALPCRQEKTLWDVPVFDIKTLTDPPNKDGDSAVVLYWDPRFLAPGKTREVGFSYGLGGVAGKKGGGQLALTVGGSFKAGDEFTATAYVNNPSPGQTVTLTLPDGFELVEGNATQAVPMPAEGAARKISPVSWRIRSPRTETTGTLTAKLSTGPQQSTRVRITFKKIFGD
jgi:hypothetical protein